MSIQTNNTEFTHLTLQTSKPNSYKNINSSQLKHDDLDNLDKVLGWTGAGYEISKQQKEEKKEIQNEIENEIENENKNEIEIKYVITYDGIPKYFVNTHDECEKVMHQYAKEYFNNILHIYNDTYTKIRIIITNDGYDIIEYNPYIPIFYDKLILNLSFYKVKSI